MNVPTYEARLRMLARADLYPVITPSLCAGRDPLLVAAACIDGGCTMLQLRVKGELCDREHLALARAVREMSAGRALLFIDDRVDIALACGADGVHVGLDDIPVREVRHIAPSLLIGGSSHNLSEALEYEAAGADYVNIGPIYATQTKSLPMAPLGPAAISTIGPRLRIPFTVMGGIKLHHLPQLVAQGARRIAMVTAITQAPDIAAQVSLFRSRLVAGAQ